ncbi:MAG: hypothetical protein R3A52_21440 [Polyangiales bacterium]
MSTFVQGPMRGWRFAGSAPQDFTCEVQAGAPRLCSKGDAPTGFATLMQTFAADDYCGRRVRWRATLRVRGVGGEGAGLWARVDGPLGEVLAFDNSAGRRRKGTASESPSAVVIDVPPRAVSVSLGVLIDGPGEVWISDAGFEVVDASVPLTADPLPRAPQNLGFTG